MAIAAGGLTGLAAFIANPGQMVRGFGKPGGSLSKVFLSPSSSLFQSFSISFLCDLFNFFLSFKEALSLPILSLSFASDRRDLLGCGLRSLRRGYESDEESPCLALTPSLRS